MVIFNRLPTLYKNKWLAYLRFLVINSIFLFVFHLERVFCIYPKTLFFLQDIQYFLMLVALLYLRYLSATQAKVLNQTDQSALEKVFLLTTNLPESEALHNNIAEAVEQSGDLSQVSALINTYMNQLITQNENGINGVAQAMFENGMDLRFSIPKIEQIITNFLREGIDSWSELFTFLIIDEMNTCESLCGTRSLLDPRITSVCCS